MKEAKTMQIQTYPSDEEGPVRCNTRNVLFTKRTPETTKDHIVCDGENWSLNIVMACRSCNSRRCDIPFRTHQAPQSDSESKNIAASVQTLIGKMLTRCL